jgi:hypothetical protein
VREACAIKHYGRGLKYMDYIWCRNKDVRDPHWQSCTGSATGIDADVIKKCADSDEGKQLVAASFAESKTAGIGASPTWIVNNKYKFSGIDAETLKTNLCSHNKLRGCENKLSAAPSSAPEPKSPAPTEEAASDTFGARHLLVMYKGSRSALPSVTRTRDEARARAAEAARKAHAGARFEDLAVEYSDEPGAAARGGDLGTFRRGQMVPEFQAAVEQLRVGEVSVVVETVFGFHVVLRTK